MGDSPVPRVVKQTVAVVVRTQDQMVVGRIHVPPGKRLKDELNLVGDRYLALTDVKVYDTTGTRLAHEAGFMLIASAHIVSITPVDGLTGPADAVGLPPRYSTRD